MLDHHEQQAHDIICMIRYGSPGGSVRNDEIRKVADYLRGGPKQRAMPVVPRIPGSNPPPPTMVRPQVPPNPPKIPTAVTVPMIPMVPR